MEHALILLSPALLAVSILFPFYWISQYRLLRRTGSWILHRDAHHRWMKIIGRGIAVSFVVILGALVFPGMFPRVHRFLESGGLLVVGGMVLVDLGILMALSHDRAAELWKAGQPSR